VFSAWVAIASSGLERECWLSFSNFYRDAGLDRLGGICGSATMRPARSSRAMPDGGLHRCNDWRDRQPVPDAEP